MTSLAHVDERLTALTRRRYDRIARVYDAVEWIMELGARRWRSELWALVGPGRVLELGVGTGKNMPFYPPHRDIVAMDISDRMLEKARARASRLHAAVRLEIADAQSLPYADESFDAVVATFLFCSVPDAQLGLREARRVLKPGGQLLLLEHVLSGRPALARLMRMLDPIPFHLLGAHIDRPTVETVRGAGFVKVATTNLWADIVKRIEARAPWAQSLRPASSATKAVRTSAGSLTPRHRRAAGFGVGTDIALATGNEASEDETPTRTSSDIATLLARADVRRAYGVGRGTRARSRCGAAGSNRPSGPASGSASSRCARAEPGASAGICRF